MKITKSQLKQIINEELNTLLNEQEYRVQQPGTSPYASDADVRSMPAGSRTPYMRGTPGGAQYLGDQRYEVGSGPYRGPSFPASEDPRQAHGMDFLGIATQPTPQSAAGRYLGSPASAVQGDNPRPLSSQEAQERLEQLALLSNEPATFADTYGAQSLLPRYVERFATGDPINPYQDDFSALAALGQDRDVREK